MKIIEEIVYWLLLWFMNLFFGGVFGRRVFWATYISHWKWYTTSMSQRHWFPLFSYSFCFLYSFLFLCNQLFFLLKIFILQRHLFYSFLIVAIVLIQIFNCLFSSLCWFFLLSTGRFRSFLLFIIIFQFMLFYLLLILFNHLFKIYFKIFLRNPFTLIDVFKYLL
jgi:hypothetical protein